MDAFDESPQGRSAEAILARMCSVSVVIEHPGIKIILRLFR